jgi:hypothetical protein
MDGIEYNENRQENFAASSSNRSLNIVSGLYQQPNLQPLALPPPQPLSNIPSHVQQPSHEQWEDIRLVLQRIYIDEGRSLENVIQFLRYQQGVKVT